MKRFMLTIAAIVAVGSLSAQTPEKTVTEAASENSQASKGTRECACSPRTGAGSPPGGHQAHARSSPGAGLAGIRARLSNA